LVLCQRDIISSTKINYLLYGVIAFFFIQMRQRSSKRTTAA
jgi:hypothetical protein